MKIRKRPFVREPLTDLEDLRDDTIAIFLNSGHTMKYIHANGGPTPGTLSKWLYKETMFPRMDTLRSVWRICGYETVLVPTDRAEKLKQDFSFEGPHVMPARKTDAKQKRTTETPRRISAYRQRSRRSDSRRRPTHRFLARLHKS